MRDLADVTARLPGRAHHFAGDGKDFENVIAGPVGRVFEASRLRRAIVGGGVEVDFEIFESFLWALWRFFLCDYDPWSEICVCLSYHGAAWNRGHDVVEVSVSVIDLLRLLKSSRHLSSMRLKEISCEVRRRRQSFVYALEMRRWI